MGQLKTGTLAVSASSDSLAKGPPTRAVFARDGAGIAGL